MAAIPKGKSPFYPGQPVPVELFAGRSLQIDHLMQRCVAQAAAGKPITVFVQGEYGIGKSSIAGYVQWLAERQNALHGIYASLGAVETMQELGAAVLEATLRSGALDSNRTASVRNWLAKYIGEQTLFGVTVHAEALKKDGPSVAAGLLPFLGEAYSRLKDTGVKGIFLALDEINGVTANPKFSHLIKGLVDTNAMSPTPLPLLLMLCGVEERRREMIRHHPPVDRIFDVVEIEAMSPKEMNEFFTKAFQSVRVAVSREALATMTEYSAGFPKIMHLVGDAAFWLDQDDVIDGPEALRAVVIAAEEVGRKYVDQQVYRALRSKDYRSILAKIAKTGLDMSFHRRDIAKGLTEPERKKFDNFLQKMKKLKVLRSGEVQGEYVFTVRMVRLYIWLNSLAKDKESLSA